MSSSSLAPRSPLWGVVAVWLVALAGGLAIAVAVPVDWRAPWFALALGGALVLSFAVQLAYGRPLGFIARVGAGVVGAALVLGLVSFVVGAAIVFPVG